MSCTPPAHAEVEERDAVVRPVQPEHLAQHSELEDRQLVEDEDGDAAQHLVSVLAGFCRRMSSPPLLAGTR
jgi:hypothetical protein